MIFWLTHFRVDYLLSLWAGVLWFEWIENDGGGSVRISRRFFSNLNVSFIVLIWYCTDAAISRCNCCTSLISFCKFTYSFFTSVTDSSTSITETLSTSSSSNRSVFSTWISRVATVSRWCPAHWTFPENFNKILHTKQRKKMWRGMKFS